ncbi:Zinc/iron permease, partial [Fistulina hepatica ATCC 64428]
VLQSGIMLHSLVIGLTLSITSGADFTSLVSAISFHQVFEGLSLGIRISALPKQGRRSITYLKLVLYVLFAVTTPTGILVGLLAFTAGSGSSTDSVQMDAVQGILSAISAGMLIYAATVEMLAGDFVFGKLGSEGGVKRQIQAVFALLLGVLCMGMLSFIE